MSETYTANGSYRLEVDDLVFDRRLGRPRNAVVLPEGWYLTASAIPATVSLLADGRVRLDFWNGAPDAADEVIKAERRVGGGGGKGKKRFLGGAAALLVEGDLVGGMLSKRRAG